MRCSNVRKAGVSLLFLLLNLASDIHCSSFDMSSAYEDNQRVLSCRGLDSCSDNRTSDSLTDYNCHCGSTCVDLDTCCYDSPHRPVNRQTPNQSIRCLRIYGGAPDQNVFMVRSCARSWSDDDGGIARDMCYNNGEDEDDPFLAIPVTSRDTGITYKNYYCAVCNNDDDPVTQWNLAIRSKRDHGGASPADPEIKYDDNLLSWTVKIGDTWTPVTLDMQVPDGIVNLVKTCRPGLISECPINWPDPSTAEECSAFMAVVSTVKYGDILRYRNPHCAVCNFESVDDLACTEDRGVVGSGTLQRTFFVGLFVLEERKRKCEKNKVYDSLSKKCRVVRCPRDQSFRNGKCVANS